MTISKKIPNMLILFLMFGLINTMCISYSGASGMDLKYSTGVWVLPRNFPKHGPEDVVDMFERAAQLGNVAQISGKWSKPDIENPLGQMQSVASQKNLQTFLVLELVDEDKEDSEWELPRKYNHKGISDLGLKAYMKQKVSLLAQQKPDYINLAKNINHMALADWVAYEKFAIVYNELYDEIKRISPKTKVMVSFDWEILNKLIKDGNQSKAKEHIGIFSAKLDLLSLSSRPYKVFENVNQLGSNYFDQVQNINPDNKPIVMNVAWPSSDSEADQVDFILAWTELFKKIKPELIIWDGLHDLKLFGFIPAGDMGSIGLLSNKGKPKASYQQFLSLRSGKPDYLASANSNTTDLKKINNAKPKREQVRKNAKDKYGIYISKLDGSELTLLHSDPKREINHARVSPDMKWVVFTRYNNFDKHGHALEVYGYERSEIAYMRLDGSDVHSLIAPRSGVVAANGYWTPDGKKILFISNDNSKRHGRILSLDWQNKTIEVVKLPDHFSVADPHQVGNRLVFPRHGDAKDKTSTLWLMRSDGTGLKQLTRPKFNKKMPKGVPLGDHDPKLSPDGKHVAVMRHVGKDNWHIVVVNIETGQERDLSKPNAVDAVPEWSSDGNLLLFWHVNKSKLQVNGLYTMKADGSQRKKVPLPNGYFYTMPAFFPDSGSGPDAKIIFTARRFN